MPFRSAWPRKRRRTGEAGEANGLNAASTSNNTEGLQWSLARGTDPLLHFHLPNLTQVLPAAHANVQP